MAKEKLTVRWLEVSVEQTGPDSWEWRAYTGKEILVYGSETSRMAARLAAYSTYFAMIEGGWK